MKSGPMRNLLLLTAWLSPLSCLAHEAPSSNAGIGLVGYGISMWEPSCAYACKRLLSLSPLTCSVQNHEKANSLQRRHGGHKDDFSTSPDCYNNDHAFLLSLAWCMHQQCSEARGTEIWRLERFWVTDAVPELHPAPNYTYAHALYLCNGDLKPVLAQGQHLKEPSSLSQKDYDAVQTWMEDYSRVEHQHARYGVLLLLSMLALPLVLTLGQFFISAFSPNMERILLAHVVEPALWGRRHLVSLPYDFGMVPLRGQMLLILFILSLNIGVSTVHYGGSMPSFKYDSESDAFWTYWSNRAGYLSFTNLVVVFLYSGRNNPLIRLSGWSYGTCILLHRWVAYICVAQGSAHSLIKLIKHIPYFSEVFAKLYWNIGFGAFIAFAVIFATSILPIRRRWYQAFLDIHNLLAVVALVLCFFHVYVEFGYNWGFGNWIVLAAMIWASERLVRLVRLAAHGAQTATITPLDEEHFEVTIEGVSQIGYTYLYFPQGWWRLWESHPFSVASSVNTLAVGTHNYSAPVNAHEAMFELGSDRGSDGDSIKSDEIEEDDAHGMLGRHSQDIRLTSLSMDEQGTSLTSPSTPLNYVENVGAHRKAEGGDEEDDALLLSSGHRAGPSLSFLMRRQRGMTNTLFHSSQPRKVLIEGPYPSISARPSLSMAAAQVVCIVGGSGITAVLPLLRARASGTVGRTVLHWGCRSEALVKASGVHDLGPAIETNIQVGQRLDLEHIVRHEAQGCYGEVAIVTCGPAGMADDVRYAVVRANRGLKGTGLLRLYEECYSW